MKKIIIKNKKYQVKKLFYKCLKSQVKAYILDVAEDIENDSVIIVGKCKILTSFDIMDTFISQADFTERYSRAVE